MYNVTQRDGFHKVHGCLDRSPPACVTPPMATFVN